VSQFDLWHSLGWRDCAVVTCAAEHGPWPLHEFRLDPEHRTCSVCYVEANADKRVRKPCITCKRATETRLKIEAPQCHKCRRRLANLDKPHRARRQKEYDRNRYKARTQ